MSERWLGGFGEDVAAGYLEERGYKILQRNFRNRFGEIDIIAQEGSYLCFVEVKTRTAEDSGSPWEAVTRGKQRAIIRMALLYLQENKLSDPLMRFDVVGIVLRDGETPDVELIKNAFDGMS